MRNIRTCATASLTLGVLAATAGQATADGGAAGYALDAAAERVTGAKTSGDGPALTPGTYRDAIERNEQRYYTVNLDGTSHAYLSVTAAPKPGQKIKKLEDGLELQLTTVDGDRCGSVLPTKVNFTGDGTTHPLTGTVSRIVGEDDKCQQRGPYLLSVGRKSSALSDPGAWPLEVRYMSEPGLKGDPPSGADSADAEESPAPDVTGEPRKARGGLGFGAARSLGDGVWKDRLKPAETRYYRVPVDWGQRLNVSVELANAEAGADAEKRLPSTVFDAFGVQLYNPARMRMGDSVWESYRGESAAIQRQTANVTYANRFDDDAKGAQVAGWHYVAVTASPELEEYFDGAAAPVTLRMEVKGKQAETPSYREDPHEAGFGVDDSDREQAAKGQTAAQAEESADRSLLGYAGIGVGTALLVGLGAWVLVARRRAAGSRSAGPPYGYGPNGPYPPRS
ncbi:hypothetical protein [Streptomyces xiaopingdaonensis]|uniref:hypothetical protein n=1 Tax=Streptomyces xiaopingdaonensis TaxID=1565415 RepID=UPI0003187E20|nr:hypothetical protein [Streptomyces xiaopingdaonensis]